MDNKQAIFIKDPNDIIKKLNNGNSFILPADDAYITCVNIFSHPDTIINFVNKKHETCFVYTYSLKMTEVFIDCNDDELELFQYYKKYYDSGLLTIGLRVKSGFFGNELVSNDGFVYFTKTTNNTFSHILENITYPILAKYVTSYDGFPMSQPELIEDYYRNKDICIHLGENPKMKGIPKTCIKLVNNSVIIKRLGHFNPNLKNDINYKYEHFETNKVSTSLVHRFQKKIIQVKILDIPLGNLPMDVYENLIILFENYAKTSILVDYDKKMFNFKEAFYGYLDLSNTGNIEYALEHFYTCLHKMDIYSVKNILIINHFLDDNSIYYNNVINQLIQNISVNNSNDIMYIPMECIVRILEKNSLN